MVRVYKQKKANKYDQDALRMAELRDNKTSLNSVAKKYGAPRTTLQFWLYKDFPTPGLQSKCRFTHVFTPDLEALREHVVTLQTIFHKVSLHLILQRRIIFVIRLISKRKWLVPTGGYFS
jgi:hypothetical protein